MRELAGLPQQLAQFRMQDGSVKLGVDAPVFLPAHCLACPAYRSGAPFPGTEDATCFCCSTGHAHPQTGAPIPCDRQLVFKLLHKWYGRDEDGAELMSGELLQEHKTLLFFDFALTSSEALYNILEFVALTAGKPEDALESFNAMVRKQLAPRVVSGLGASTLPLPYTVCLRSMRVHPSVRLEQSCVAILPGIPRIANCRNPATLRCTCRALLRAFPAQVHGRQLLPAISVALHSTLA